MLIGEFSDLQWTAMLVIGMGAGLIHGFVGIGFPLIATPLFALLFGFQRAVPILVLPTLLLVFCTFVAFGRAIDPREAFRRYWPLLLMSPIGVVLGTRALFLMDHGMLKGISSSDMARVAARMTELEWEAGHTVRFHLPSKGFRRGERVTVVGVDADGKVTVEKPTGERRELPLKEAKRFQVYERDTCEVALGDRLRITENGMARDGSRLFNGATYEVKGFAEDGGIILSNGKVLAPDFGAIAHGYCTTSHSSQGKTVDHVLIAESS